MLRYSKVREVKSPNRANPTDAGMDMFVPVVDDKFKADFAEKNECANVLIIEGAIYLAPHGRACIPSGCHFDIEEGYALIANNKSGIATKLGLVYGAAVCDSDYQGEVHISLINTTNKTIKLSESQKIIQFLYMPIRTDIPEEVPFEDLYIEETERGEDGFGSTDNK